MSAVPSRLAGRLSRTQSRRRARLQLEPLEDRAVPAADWAEPNNGPTAPYNFGPVQGSWFWDNLSIHSTTDDDWYRFETDRAAGATNSIRIDFNDAQGDLELALYDASAQFIDYSAQANVNTEQVSLDGLPAGTYYARVYSYWHDVNPRYKLTLNTPTDRFESNDGFAIATDLGSVQGQQAVPNLSLDHAGDQDLFKFTLAAAGAAAHYARIDFQNAWGNLGLALYDSAEQLIDNSNTTSNVEQLSLAGLAPGLYYLQVYGTNDATNIHYELSLNTPSLSGDRFEPNDFAYPTLFGLLEGQHVEDNLTINSNTDHDWFKFQTAATGTGANFLRIDFSNVLGDLELAVYDANGDFLTYSAHPNVDTETVPLTNLPAGTYYARVYSFHGHTNPYYKLTFNTPFSAGASGDALELNDSAASATNLGLLASGSRTTRDDLSIHSGTDEDWFKFQLGTAGQSGNAVGIDFSHAQGDIDMELYNSAGTSRLAFANGTGDSESISLAGRAAGVYYVRVFGYNGARNSNYALTVTAPQSSSIGPDSFESPNNNNAIGQATELGSLSGGHDETGLTITAGDVDFFKFTTTASGTAAHSVRIEFNRTSGDLALRLYDQNQQPLSITAVTGTNSKSLSLNGLAAGAYYVRVAGAAAATANHYSLHIDPPTTAAQDDWTVMIYATASNLEDWSAEKINQLERLTSEVPGSVHFVVLWDQTDSRVQVPDPYNGSLKRAAHMFATGNGAQPAWGDTGLAVIAPDTNAASDDDFSRNRIVTTFKRIGEKDTGEAGPLTELINYAVENAPASHYALVLQDHGGYYYSNADMDGSGSPFPSNQWQGLTVNEVSSAIDDAIAVNPGLSFDVLAYDTCLMAGVEVAYALRGYADYFIGSEEEATTGTFDYYDDFQVLTTNPGTVTGHQFANAVQTRIGQTLTNNFTSAQNNWGTTISAVQTSALDDLATRLAAFVTSTAGATAADWEIISRARLNADAFKMYQAGSDSVSACRDLGNFMDYLANQTGLTASIRSAAADAATALHAAVLGYTSVHRTATGLSVYLQSPGNQPDFYFQDGATAFQAATSWSTFLTRFAANGRAVSAGTGGVATGTQGVTVNNTADWAGGDNGSFLSAFDLHTLVGSGNVFPGLTLRDYTSSGNDEDWFKFTLAASGSGGNRVYAISDDTVAGLRLTLYSAADPDTPVAGPSAGGNSLEVVSMAGLPAGDYYLKVEFASTPAFLPYTLGIDAPTGGPDADWAVGNISSAKATSLGAIGPAAMFSGLTIGPRGQDWFSFTTPVTLGGTASATLHVRPTGHQKLTAQLYSNGRLVRTETGTGELNLTFAYGGSQTFRLVVRNAATTGPANPYAIYFDGPDTAAGEGTFQDTFDRGNDGVLGLAWTELAGDFNVVGNQAIADPRSSLATVNGYSAADVSVRAEVSVTRSGQSAGLTVRHSGPGDRNLYYATLSNSGGRIGVSLYRNVGGRVIRLGAKAVGTSSATLRLDAIGSTLSVFVNGNLMLSVRDTALSAGGVGVRGSGGAFGSFSAVRLTGVTLPFGDDFNRADSSIVGDHWVSRQGEAAVLGNRLTSTTSVPGVFTLMTAAVADVGVQAAVNLSAVGVQSAGLVARYTGPGDRNMYVGQIEGNNGSFTASILRNLNGRWTVLQSAAVASGTGLLRFEADGSSLTLTLDGNTLVSAVDHAIAGPGLSGVRLGSGSSVDDFDVDSLSI